MRSNGLIATLLFLVLFLGQGIAHAQPEREPVGNETSMGPKLPPAPTGLASEGLSVESLQELALAYNPTIDQARAGVARASGQRLQVGLRPHLGFADKHPGPAYIG